MAKTPKTVAELYALHESLRAKGAQFYEQSDIVLTKLLRVWKKDRQAKVDPKHILHIEDQFHGQTKAFAPAYARRYKLTLKAVE